MPRMVRHEDGPSCLSGWRGMPNLEKQSIVCADCIDKRQDHIKIKDTMPFHTQPIGNLLYGLALCGMHFACQILP